MTDLADYLARPGDRLLEILAKRKIDPHDFAVDAQMVVAGSKAADYRRRCYQQLCKYTRADKAKRKYPSPAMLCLWAVLLGIDPGYFTSGK